MRRTRIFRLLRIAWSVAWSLIAVLLCVLWLSSYSWNEAITRISSKRIIRVSSVNGNIHIWHEGNLTAMYWPGGPQWSFSESKSPRHGPGNVVSSGRPTLTISYRLPVLCAACITAAPWIRWSKRFGLRTLLITTTLVALLLGAIVYAIR